MYHVPMHHLPEDVVVIASVVDIFFEVVVIGFFVEVSLMVVSVEYVDSVVVSLSSLIKVSLGLDYLYLLKQVIALTDFKCFSD